jgi:hypothetical protein
VGFEPRRQNVQTLSEAVAAADRLVDFHRRRHESEAKWRTTRRLARFLRKPKVMKES